MVQWGEEFHMRNVSDSLNVLHLNKPAANNPFREAIRGGGREASNPLYNHSCSNTALLLTSSLLNLKTFHEQLSYLTTNIS